MTLFVLEDYFGKAHKRTDRSSMLWLPRNVCVARNDYPAQWARKLPPYKFGRDERKKSGSDCLSQSEETGTLDHLPSKEEPVRNPSRS